MRVTSYTIPIELLERARIQSVQELGTAAGFVEVAEVPVVVVLELVVPVLVVLVLVVLDEASRRESTCCGCHTQRPCISVFVSD